MLVILLYVVSVVRFVVFVELETFIRNESVVGWFFLFYFFFKKFEINFGMWIINIEEVFIEYNLVRVCLSKDVDKWFSLVRKVR